MKGWFTHVHPVVFLQFRKPCNFEKTKPAIPKMRIYSVELAIQELDDKRMLRIRQEARAPGWVGSGCLLFHRENGGKTPWDGGPFNNQA